MTDKQLLSLCRKWQKRLGLGHWDITFHPHPDLPADGLTESQWAYLTADIYICIRRHSTNEAVELTVVHELCHVLLSAWPDHDNDDDPRMSMEERTVEELSRAMLNLGGSLLTTR